MTKPGDIPFVDLAAQFESERAEVLECVEQVFAKGDFVGGSAIEVFEANIAAYCGTAHAVAVSSGTAALEIGLRVLGIGRGDEVITAPNSFITTVSSIVSCGATPVFADVRDDQNIDPNAIEAAITPRTKAILPIHLTGRIADMAAINAIAERHGLAVVEDAAQAVGSKLDGQLAGSFGAVGCFSAHPLKNLNASGDAGFITTNDAGLADQARLLRNAGLADRDTATEWSGVARMDTLQALILSRRLPQLGEVLSKRRRNAEIYFESFADGAVFAPPERQNEFNTYHTFVIQADDRDGLKSHLAEQGIGSAVHYPRPIHLQPAAAELDYREGDFPIAERQAGRILSLPIHQFLSGDDVVRVAETVVGYCTGPD